MTYTSVSLRLSAAMAAQDKPIDLKVGEDTKPGLVRVNRRTGNPEGEIALGTKKPDYMIDSAGQVIFKPDSRTLQCYRF